MDTSLVKAKVSSIANSEAAETCAFGLLSVCLWGMFFYPAFQMLPTGAADKNFCATLLWSLGLAVFISLVSIKLKNKLARVATYVVAGVAVPLIPFYLVAKGTTFLGFELLKVAVLIAISSGVLLGILGLLWFGVRQFL